VTEQPVAVVTGASSGIGRAIARELATAGYAVGLIARSEEGLAGALRDVERAGSRGVALPTDVADAAAVDAPATAAEQALGPIDLWVNDAMVTVFAGFQEVEPEEYQRATDVTYHGTVWGTRAALKRMVPRNRGTIIQVGSALAFRGIPLQAPYCGAKHAIKGFTESVITELVHQGSDVHLGMVHLPGVNTPQFDHCRSKMPKHPMPVPPVYQPEVAARAVLMAVRKRRRQVFVGIPTVYTIWGNRLAPWLADRYLARTAVKGQQTDEPVPRAEHDNLFEPSPGDPGAHGAFDDQAHERSVQLWATEHRARLLVGAGAAAVAGVVALQRS
jgi:NAD(P)-dependent dehydrogenase (short-subunit alcohol dehydrogenase family)